MNSDCEQIVGPCTCGAWHKKEEFVVQSLKNDFIAIQLNCGILHDHCEIKNQAMSKIEEICKRALEKINEPN